MAHPPNRHAGGGPARHGGQRPGGGAPSRGNGPEPAAPNAEFQSLLGKIRLADPKPDLFDTTAQGIAKTLRPSASHGPNKRSQVRRFYDELMRFRMRLPEAHAKTDGSDTAFHNALPFIRMLNARAAYAAERKAEGGKLVSPEFTAFLRRLLEEVKDRRTLANACTLFEAVIGFMPPDRG